MTPDDVLTSNKECRFVEQFYLYRLIFTSDGLKIKPTESEAEHLFCLLLYSVAYNLVKTKLSESEAEANLNTRYQAL